MRRLLFVVAALGLSVWLFLAGTPRPPIYSTVLTERLRDVARCVSVGMTNKEIAQALGISMQRVKNHLTVAFDKAGVVSRTQLGIYYHRHWGLAADHLFDDIELYGD